jgi:chemotaxis protein MotB
MRVIMAGKGERPGNKRAVIVKKFDIVESAHHGGAWKVAYADFVTAMMAFFLLMWLLNATTEDQRRGLADYFSPNNLMSHTASGSGQPFGGRTAFAEGALASDLGAVQVTMGKRPVVADTDDAEVEVNRDTLAFKPENQGRQRDLTEEGSAAMSVPRSAEEMQAERLAGPSEQEGLQQADGARGPTEAELRADRERHERETLEQAAEQIRQAVRDDPALAELAKQLAIDMTPEGLRIQIMDEVQQPMFATGASVLNGRARLLLQKVLPVLRKLPQPISIAGHTDAAPYSGPGRTNWELSTERANATRRLLVEGGLAVGRVRTVTGHADRDPLLPADPFAAANRRIAIVVLREANQLPPAPVAR